MRILDALMARQLAFGGPILGGPARFLWNFGDSDVPEDLRRHTLLTVDQDDHYIVTYTREDLKAELVDTAESTSLEKVCMISMLPMEPNRSLRILLDAAFEGRGGETRPQPVDAVPALTFVPEDQVATRTRSSSGSVGSRR
ncbi:hypothetical protein [Luteimonas deserti]|uniref:Uncharacterized protein n=1 Tax=Luteimonas deserti TaxID=2752306 RepID=A0A7Z0QS05_9GAMM|nr:hypothetical protein [Luteimonas deserti]NYZ61945.1 hypothetical protein [Luteimonas deserti]